jgi:hypothetical protein
MVLYSRLSSSLTDVLLIVCVNVVTQNANMGESADEAQQFTSVGAVCILTYKVNTLLMSAAARPQLAPASTATPSASSQLRLARSRPCRARQHVLNCLTHLHHKHTVHNLAPHAHRLHCPITHTQQQQSAELLRGPH